MDIHPPAAPVRSVKEFGVHIAIVTIGILIALSLEGLIETVHDHGLVRETRQNFQVELLADQEHSHLELARVSAADAALQSLVADLPTLIKNHPEQIAPRLAAIENPGYFIEAEGWQAALSTGALAHMSTDEVQRYANVYYIIRFYTDVQRSGIAAEDQAKAFFLGRPKSTAAELSEGAERIVLFARAEKVMDHVCRQMDGSINEVLPPEKKDTQGRTQSK